MRGDSPTRTSIPHRALNDDDDDDRALSSSIQFIHAGRRRRAGPGQHTYIYGRHTTRIQFPLHTHTHHICNLFKFDKIKTRMGVGGGGMAQPHQILVDQIIFLFDSRDDPESAPKPMKKKRN